jgi:CRP-like cAMP-binding protein
MYFIREGIVNILSPNENEVITSLARGDYFGEIALFIADSRRICSVVAASNFVQAFILRKKDLKRILERFPTIEEKFKSEGKKSFRVYIFY